MSWNRNLRLWVAGWIVLAVSALSTTAEEAKYPLTIAVAENGTCLVSDLRLPGLWKYDGTAASIFFQADKKFRTPLNTVRCVRVDRKGRVLACDSSTREVYRFDEQGQPQGLTKGFIGIPMDVAEAENGELFVSDLETHRIWKVPAEGGEPQEFAAVPAPRGLRFDAAGKLWVVSHGKNQLVRLTPAAVVETVVTGRPFQFPHEVLIQQDGSALVSDGYAKAIWKVPAEGAPVKWIEGEPLQNPVGLGQRGDNVLIVDPRAKTVFQADADGKLTVFWDGTGKK